MKIKFKISIGTPTTAIILISTLIIIYYNYVTTSKVIYNMANEILNGNSKRIFLKLKNFFEPISAQTMFLSDVIDDENYFLSEKREEYLKLMAKYLKQYNQIAFIYIADEDGNLSQVRKEAGLTTRIIDKKNANEIWKKRDVEFQTIVKTENKIDFDIRTRTWYQNVKNSKKPNWSKPYEFQSTENIGITFSYPLFDEKSGSFFGTISADIISDEISLFLKNEKVYESETSYIIGAKGTIFAYSDYNNSDSGLDLINKNIEFLDSKVGQAYRSIKKSNKDILQYKFNDKKYFGKITELESKLGQYKLITVVDESEIFDEIKLILRKSILISFLVLFFAIYLLIKFIDGISRSIDNVTTRSKQLRRLDFFHPIPDTSMIYEISQMQKSLEALRNAMYSFSKYIPFDIVAQIIKGQSEAKLGGEKKEITLMFTDISNFTSIIEEENSEMIIKRLTLYFDEINKIVTNTRGIVDKFIGDGTMSFWGAPIENEENAISACYAALECKNSIKELNLKWEAEGKIPFNTRIGINTGETIVGNVGSKDRMNYTAMGDSVNVTARLESLCKDYRVEIIISESTYMKVKEFFICKSLGKACIRGKKDKMEIYELLDNKIDKYS